MSWRPVESGTARRSITAACSGMKLRVLVETKERGAGSQEQGLVGDSLPLCDG